MKVSVLHRKQQAKAVEAIKHRREAERVIDGVDIAAQAARARNDFIASREDFAARAAKARSLLPNSSPAVMLG